MVGNLVLGRNGYGQHGHVKGIEGSMSSALWNQEDNGGGKGREVEGRPVARSKFSDSCTQPMGRALFAAAMPLIAVHGACATVGIIHIPIPSPPGTKTGIWKLLMCLGRPRTASCVCPSSFLQRGESTQPVFLKRFSPLFCPPSLAQASWRRCYESGRLEKAPAATRLHLKGPRRLRTPP